MTGRIETREQVRAELRRLLAEMTRKGPVKQSDIIAVFNDSFELSRAVERELVNDALKADLTDSSNRQPFFRDSTPLMCISAAAVKI